MKSNMDLDLKSKRIVHQMSRELEKTDVNDDFHTVLLTLDMPKSDRKAGFNGYLKLQNEIKESLKDYLHFGEKSEILKLLSRQELKCVTQMLKSRSSRSTDRDSGQGSSKDRNKSENGELSGERVIAKKVKVVVEDVEEDIPRAPVPFGIPPLQVDQLYENMDDTDDLEWVSSQPGRSSSRIPEIPMEPVPKPISHRHTEQQKNVTFAMESPPKKILSRARRIQKNDAQIQTDEVEEEEKEVEEKVQIQTAEIGTNCRILITPRVEELEELISQKSPLLSPMSTVPSDLSEGEVVGGNSMGRVIVVRTDGSLVPTPRAIEDVEDEDVVGYDGDYDVASDILIARSTSSFGVAEVDMSISSAHSH